MYSSPCIDCRAWSAGSQWLQGKPLPRKSLWISKIKKAAKNANLQGCDRIKAPLQSGLSGFDGTRKTSHRRFPEQMSAFYFGNTYFLSRTSNAEVLQRSGHVSVSKLLERKPLLLLGKILRHPNHPLRQASFAPGTYTATSRYLRVGRPRKEWMKFFQHFLLQVVCTICCILSWNAVAPAGFEPMNRSGSRSCGKVRHPITIPTRSAVMCSRRRGLMDSMCAGSHHFC